MHSAFISKLSDKEYRDLTKKLYDIQSGKCFICGQDINLELQETNIDHIIPLNTGGKDNENNFALTHEICNKSKQDANLDVARAIYRLKIIQDEVSKSDNRAASLQDLLNSIGGSKYKLNFTIKGNVFENDSLGYGVVNYNGTLDEETIAQIEKDNKDCKVKDFVE